MAFSDYCKDTLRTVEINQIPTAMLFSHDSIAGGEDGSTHQLFGQINGLRIIPNFRVFRLCDGKEPIGTYKICLESKNTPAVICLIMQDIPTINGSRIDIVQE